MKRLRPSCLCNCLTLFLETVKISRTGFHNTLRTYTREPDSQETPREIRICAKSWPRCVLKISASLTHTNIKWTQKKKKEITI